MSSEEKELAIDEMNAIMLEFLKSYTQKLEETSDREWLISTLSQYMPDTARVDIVRIADELITETERLSELTKEVVESDEVYGLKAETWLYNKIKRQLSDDDKYIENLAEIDKIFYSLIMIIMDGIDEHHKKIKWFDEDVHDDGDRKNDDKDTDYDENKNISKHTKVSDNKTAVKNDTNPIITASAFSAGAKKTAMAQYQKFLKIDLGNMNMRNYDTTEAAMRISKSAALSGMGSIALTTGFTLIGKMMQGNLKLNQTKMLNMVLKTGADNGLRTAVGGALKVSAERGLLPMLSRATPARTLAAITCIGVENMKIIYKYAEGNISALEAMEQAGKVSTACVFSIGFGIKGAVIGAAAFSVIPIAGPIVGAILGEMLGNVVGGQVGTVAYYKVKDFCLTAKYAALANYDVILRLEEMLSEPLTKKVKYKRRQLLPNWI